MKFYAVATAFVTVFVAISSVTALNLGLTPVAKSLRSLSQTPNYIISHVRSFQHRSGKSILQKRSELVESNMHDIFEPLTSMMDNMLTLKTKEDYMDLKKKIIGRANEYKGIKPGQEKHLSFALTTIDEILSEYVGAQASPRLGTIMESLSITKILKNLKSKKDIADISVKIDNAAAEIIQKNKCSEGKILEVTVEAIILKDFFAYLRV